MADRVYPASKPTPKGAGAAPIPAVNGGAANPPTKAQLYNANRPVYRPQPPPSSRKHCRSCCCRCCLWTTLVILILLLLAAAASAVFYVLYRPHRPTFQVSSLQLSQFNLTGADHLTTKFNLTVVARNPNKKISYLYDRIAVTVFSDGIDVGDGSFPGFVHGKKNSTLMKAVISSSGKSLDGASAATVKSNLKNKNGLPLEIRLDTKVKAKVGGVETKKIGIRVRCDGVRVAVPAGKSPATANADNIKCKVDVRIKIWKWTV